RRITQNQPLSLHDALPISLRARQAAAGLTKVLKMLPQTTMEHLAIRFNRCSLRDESEHVANLAAGLGEEAAQYRARRAGERSHGDGGTAEPAGPAMSDGLSARAHEGFFRCGPGPSVDLRRAAR